MQAALQYFPCLTNPVTAALEGCSRRLEEHLKLALDFYQPYEHTRKSYAQQTPDHSSQGQYFNPRITLPNKLFASLKHIRRPSLYFGITYLSENTAVTRNTFQQTWVQRHPWDRAEPAKRPSVRLVPAKMQPCTAERCLGRSANSFTLYSVFPSARHIKWANPTTA